MKYLSDIRTAQHDAQQLELLYQAARKENASAEFEADLRACHAESGDNLLYTAWFYRFEHRAQDEAAERRNIHWKLAVPLSLLTGLIFWLLSDDRLKFSGPAPQNTYLALLWAPIVGLIVITFLTITAKSNYQRAIMIGAGLIGVSAYVMLLAPNRQPYRELMALHLPLIALAGVGVSLLGLGSTPKSRVAFLTKCIEVIVTGGLYLIAVVIFSGITISLFQALGITIPDVIIRLLMAGGIGLIPVAAVATIYDPLIGPLDQDFKRGLGRLVATLPRLLLPLTLIVLVIYLIAIPFNFMAPFKNRDVLVIYNGMLFAVMGLLLGAAPLHAEDLSPRYQTALRSGITALAILVVVVSLYALSATVYRTVLGGLTLNRVTIIGWNSLNLGLLALLIYKQLRRGAQTWIDSLHSVFGLGTVGYVAWGLFLVLATPWLF
jgi:hypothetical protein